MELFLNSLWAAFAIVCLAQWHRGAHREKRERHTTFVALVMLVVILFPVISVSDDLWAIQNPAEADSFVRRDSHAPLPQSVHHPVAGLPEVATAGQWFGPGRSQAIVIPLESNADWPLCDSLQNRPPPQA